jgi:hypothetical protein
VAHEAWSRSALGTFQKVRSASGILQNSPEHSNTIPSAKTVTVSAQYRISGALGTLLASHPSPLPKSQAKVPGSDFPNGGEDWQQRHLRVIQLPAGASILASSAPLTVVTTSNSNTWAAMPGKRARAPFPPGCGPLNHHPACLNPGLSFSITLTAPTTVLFYYSFTASVNSYIVRWYAPVGSYCRVT